MESKRISSIKRSFSTGLVVLLPFAATIWVIIWLLRTLESLLIKPLFQAQWTIDFFNVLPPGLIPWIEAVLGLALIFIVICILGWLTTNFIGKWFLGKVDWVMKKVPLANTVYIFVKGLIENLGMMRSGYFQQVVLVEFPCEGSWSVGFIARDAAGSLQASSEQESVAVYMPSSPNPTNGFLIVVNKSDIRYLDIPPEEALKFIVSGGVVMPGPKVEPETSRSGT